MDLLHIPSPQRPLPASRVPRAQHQTSNGDLVLYEAHAGLNEWWQIPVLKWFVQGRHVYDFGAGQLYWAHRLLQLGATRVTAVDYLYRDRSGNHLNQYRNWTKCAPDGCCLDNRTFHDFYQTGPKHLQVAFVSWPCNTYGKTMGLELTCERAQVLIYAGSNFDGTACGSLAFWALARRREVLAYAPARGNSLIVYGPQRLERDPLPEELATDPKNVHSTPSWFP
jgi:hypothetical protein